MTECNQTAFRFEAHFSRQVVAAFDGSRMTADGGVLLLRAVDGKIRLLKQHRSPNSFLRLSKPCCLCLVLDSANKAHRGQILPRFSPIHF
jgi:hypothetical protein